MPFESVPNTRGAYVYKAHESLENEISPAPLQALISTTPEALQDLINAYRACSSSEDKKRFESTLKQGKLEQFQLIQAFKQIVKDITRSCTLSFPNEGDHIVVVLSGQTPISTSLKLSDPEKHVILLDPAQATSLQESLVRLDYLRKKAKDSAPLTEQDITERDALTEATENITAIKMQRAEAALAHFLFESRPKVVKPSQLVKIGPMQGLLTNWILYLQADLTINGQQMQGRSSYDSIDVLFQDADVSNDVQLHSTSFIYHLQGATDDLCYYKEKNTQRVITSDDMELAQAIAQGIEKRKVTGYPPELTVHYNGTTLILEPLVSVQQVVKTGVKNDSVRDFETKFNIHQPDIVMKRERVRADLAAMPLPKSILPPVITRVGLFIKNSWATIRDTIVALASAIYTRFLKKETVLPAMEVPLEAQPISQSSPSTTTLELRSSESSDNNVAPMSSAQSMLNYKTYCQKRDDRTITSNNDEIGMTVNVASQGLLTQYEYYIAPNQDLNNPGMVFKAVMESGRIEDALIQIICEDAADAAIAAYRANGAVTTFDLSSAPNESVEKQIHEVFLKKLSVFPESEKPFEIKRFSELGNRSTSHP